MPHRLRLVLAALCALALTACHLDVTVDVAMQPDGTGTVTVVAIADPELVSQVPDRIVGEALLDQRLIAGIGTFFMSEACFLRGVNPWQPVGDVSDLRALVQMAHRLMTANVDRAVQVTTGDARRGQEQWVHSRSGRPCRRCRTTVRVAQLGLAPTQRVAFWCPSCQPGVVPTDTGARQRPLGASRRAPARRP